MISRRTAPSLNILIIVKPRTGMICIIPGILFCLVAVWKNSRDGQQYCTTVNVVEQGDEPAHIL